MVLLLTADTPLALSLSDRKLLAQFVRGVITLDQLLGLVEDRLETVKAMVRLGQLAKGNSLLESPGLLKQSSSIG